MVPDVNKAEEVAQTFMFADDGVVPNNPVLPVVVEAAGIQPPSGAEIRTRYRKNGWGGTWEFTVFDYTHYHPDAHEVLTCSAGWGDVELGGEKGRTFRLTPGDVAVLPAGTGHRLVASSDDFSVIGAYPPGQEAPEIRRATQDNYDGTPERIGKVALPQACPFKGEGGPSMQAWIR